MRRAILVPTVRPDMMATFMRSLSFLGPAWKVYIGFQGYTDAQVAGVLGGPEGHRVAGYERMERTPPYVARARMLARWRDEVDVWVSCDDDMEMLASVDYETLALRALEPSVGVVSGNWAKSESHLRNSRFEVRFVRQPIVNMAGGMCYARKVVDVLLAAPVQPYMFCDVQVALLAYVAGFENFRYLGSLILHKIMSKGGLLQSYAQREFDLPPADLMTVVPAAGGAVKMNNYYMPSAKQLLPRAHELHRANRAGRS